MLKNYTQEEIQDLIAMERVWNAKYDRVDVDGLPYIMPKVAGPDGVTVTVPFFSNQITNAEARALARVKREECRKMLYEAGYEMKWKGDKKEILTWKKIARSNKRDWLEQHFFKVYLEEVAG